MTFRQRNTYYLRLSSNAVLPLFLYLDERHIGWMSDIVLQHVLVDLRPLVIPKLQAEKDVHFDLRASMPGSKRGTVEVHRGETYQFAYFFRKTEPHTVLFKSRYFVTAPLHTEAVPKPTSSRPADLSSSRQALTSTKQSKRKRVKTTGKGKGKVSFDDLNEDEWTAEETEEHDDTDPMPREPRPVRKQRRIIYQEEENVNEAIYMRQDVMMDSPSPGTDGGSSGDPRGGDSGLQTESHIMQDTAIEEVDRSRMDGRHDAVTGDTTNRPMLAPDIDDIELVVEEEEKKPKPLLKLKYQSFHISGHCLCVVVEPWPPLRAETSPQSVALGTPLQRVSLEPMPSGSVIAGQRAKTPLFLPEYDRAPSEAPPTREKTRPPVPLFQDAISRIEDKEDEDYSDGDLMNFSQTLNAAGHMHAITADDDDDMDGAILFGDADEVRELL